MKIVSITPIHVTAAELERRQQRYNRIAPAGVTVELHNLSQNSPTALDSPTDVVASDASVKNDIAGSDQAAELLAQPLDDQRPARLRHSLWFFIGFFGLSIFER